MTTSGPSTPRRKAELSPRRRLSRNVLWIGTVLALVAATGPGWAARAGVLVALAAAFVACLTAWREVDDARRQHASDLLTASKAHGAQLSDERRHNATVVDALTVRFTSAVSEVKGHQAQIVELTATVLRLTSTIGSLKAELSNLQSDHAAARQEIGRRKSDIAALQETVRAREADITALEGTVRAREAELQAQSGTGGQVRAMPRRMLTEHDAVRDRAPEADLLSRDARHPSVLELTDVSVVLPNYEGDRRLA